MVKETRALDNNHSAIVTWQEQFLSLNQKIEIVEKVVFYKMFSKFKIEKPPNVLYKRGPRHFEAEQSVISLPLLEVYDQQIRHLRAENEQLRAENNGQATELAVRRAEVFQLRQELQLLRDEVAQSRLAVNSAKNTVKFNVSRKSYWDVDRAARSLKRKKIGDYLRNAVEILPAEFKPIEVRIITKFPW